MCGRYTLHHTTADIIERFGIQLNLFDVSPRYNIAPSQELPVVISNDGRKLERLQWGLIPFWAKDLKKARPMINARMETIAEKPTFKASFKRRRCLVPADGFYEWRSENDKRVPIHIRLAGGGLFAFAGMWDEWTSPDGDALRTFTIITVPAQAWIREVHDRMPAILRREDEDAWLDPQVTASDELLPLLQKRPATQIVGYDVSPKVNKPKYDEPACIEPAEGGRRYGEEPS